MRSKTRPPIPARNWRPRFSLGVLMYGILFLASSALIWLNREAWNVERKEWVSFMSMVRLGDSKYLVNSPDGTRYLSKMGFKTSVSICDVQKRQILYPLEFPNSFSGAVVDAEFMDDDHIKLYFENLDDEEGNHVGVAYVYRRFPEWWWGHAYRPEIWLALIFGILTLRELWRMPWKKQDVPPPPQIEGVGEPPTQGAVS